MPQYTQQTVKQIVANEKEIEVFFCVQMTMAIIKNKGASIQDILFSRIPLLTYCNCNDFEEI